MNREEIITSTGYWEEWLDLTELNPIEDRADFITNVVKEALSLTHTEGEEDNIYQCPFGSDTTSLDTFSTCRRCGKKARF